MSRQGKEASDRASAMQLPWSRLCLRVGQSPMTLMSKIDALIVSLIGYYVGSTKAISDLSQVNEACE